MNADFCAHHGKNHPTHGSWVLYFTEVFNLVVPHLFHLHKNAPGAHPCHELRSSGNGCEPPSFHNKEPCRSIRIAVQSVGGIKTILMDIPCLHVFLVVLPYLQRKISLQFMQSGVHCFQQQGHNGKPYCYAPAK